VPSLQPSPALAARARFHPAMIRGSPGACVAPHIILWNGCVANHSTSNGVAGSVAAVRRTLAMRLRRTTRTARTRAAGTEASTRRPRVRRRRMAAIPRSDAQLLPDHPGLLQVAHDLRRHAGRQVEDRMVLVDVDAADVARFQAGLVGDRADDVARLDAMHVAEDRKSTRL